VTKRAADQKELVEREGRVEQDREDVEPDRGGDRVVEEQERRDDEDQHSARALAEAETPVCRLLRASIQKVERCDLDVLAPVGSLQQLLDRGARGNDDPDGEVGVLAHRRQGVVVEWVGHGEVENVVANGERREAMTAGNRLGQRQAAP